MNSMGRSISAYVVGRPTRIDGDAALVAIVEPNGDEHRVECTCRETGTEIGCLDAEYLKYLTDRYGHATIWRTVRDAALGHDA